MSLLYFESFDLPGAVEYRDTATFYWNWDTVGEFCPVAGAGRRGTAAFQSLGYFWGDWATLHLDTSRTVIVMGFALKVDFLQAYTDFLSVRNSLDQDQFKLTLNLDGSVDVLTPADAVISSTAADAITYFDYQYVELKFTCTGSDTLEMRVDGATVLSLTGVDLRGAGTGSIEGLRYFVDPGANQKHLFLDDLYICDTAGADFNDFQGDVKVDAFVPTGDGDHTDFTPSSGTDHYALVDDTVSTNYVESGTLTHKDSYTMTITGDMPTIHAVALCTAARNPEPGQAGGKPFYRISATDYDEDEALWGDTAMRDFQIAFGNPATGLAWTKMALETTEIGIHFTSAT